ncbi:MAG: sugar transferase [Candidatus Spechtbacterales bacterium]|nr:sugar transferase [Candidatus Spechtbacterales bacterium]
MRKNDLIFNLILLPLDFALLIAAGVSAYYLRFAPPILDIKPVLFSLPIYQYMTFVVVISTGMILIFAISGLYLMRRTTPIFREITRVTLDVSAGMALVIMFMFFNRELFDSRFILLAGWVFGIIFVIFGRLLIRGLRRLLLRTKGLGVENVLILGNSDEAKYIKRQIKKSKGLGLRLVGSMPEPNLSRVMQIHKEKGLQRVLAVDSDFGRNEIMRVVNYCEENGIQFSYTPDMFGAIIADMSLDILEGVPVVSVKPSPLDGWSRVLKRLVDIFGSIFGLVLLAPIFILIAIAIKWETSGPILVKLKRISHGKEFDLYKFRSMIKDAHKYKKELMDMNERSGPLFKIKDDPRITKVGRFLRAKRLDELPQLINVLKGDISLVGPRPHEPEEIAQYKDYHKKVLAIKSGITGMAQVSGASDLSFEEEVKLDRFYIEHWSLKKDIIILFKTVKLLLLDRSGV